MISNFRFSVIMILLLVGVCFGRYSGGTGDPNDPYQIGTAADLDDIGNHVEDFNKCFVVVNDVNFAAYTGPRFNVIGSYDNPFSGVFDGNGHAITNFNYYSPVAGSQKGLFGYVNGIDAEIKNLGIVDVNVVISMSNAQVGAIVGVLIDGKVRNCYVRGGQVGIRKKPRKFSELINLLN